jgi:CRP-like cAMP-binding protein
VSDDGTPFKPRSGSELDLTVALQERKIGGLGIHLVKNVMDEVRCDRQANRNVVSAVKYFGDLSLLLGEKRTASVTAVSFAEAFVLSRDDFERIKRDFSEFREVLKQISSERSKKSAELLLEGIIL